MSPISRSFEPQSPLLVVLPMALRTAVMMSSCAADPGLGQPHSEMGDQINN